MKVEEALPVLKAACGKPFRELFIGHPEDLRTNKGNVGQLLLIYSGLKLNSDNTDFDDGELKTNKANPDGTPKETMFITQISKNIDIYIGCDSTPFESTMLYEKIRNIVYLPVVKDSENAGDWYFTDCIQINLDKSPKVHAKLREDYEVICEGLKEHLKGHDGFIHTTNGPHYLQIRSKDSKPYFPIYSTYHKRAVSNKNHAFYFKKSFMLDAIARNI